jgi:hypothetical protein
MGSGSRYRSSSSPRPVHRVPGRSRSTRWSACRAPSRNWGLGPLPHALLWGQYPLWMHKVPSLIATARRPDSEIPCPLLTPENPRGFAELLARTSEIAGHPNAAPQQDSDGSGCKPVAAPSSSVWPHEPGAHLGFWVLAPSECRHPCCCSRAAPRTPAPHPRYIRGTESGTVHIPETAAGSLNPSMSRAPIQYRFRHCASAASGTIRSDLAES